MRVKLLEVPSGGIVRLPDGQVWLVEDNCRIPGGQRLLLPDGRRGSAAEALAGETVELLTTTTELALRYMARVKGTGG